MKVNYKQIFTLLILPFFASFGQSQDVNYAVISGKITNPVAGKELKLFNRKENKSTTFKINSDGSFKETVKLDKANYFTFQYLQGYPIFIKNGMDLKIALNSQDQVAKFEGKGSIENSILSIKDSLKKNMTGEYPYEEFLSLNEKEYNEQIDAYKKAVTGMLTKSKTEIDASFYDKQIEDVSKLKENMQPMYEEQKKALKVLAPGMPSPEFNDYINYKGGTTSLKDLRGKYVYIDIWATWCHPCVDEIPFLNEIEEKYKDKNIAFVSISIDREKEEGQWRNMIKEKNMGGIQLWAGKNSPVEFTERYFIQGIPRFILLDPNGNIIKHNAPRPSDKKLVELLNGLKL